MSIFVVDMRDVVGNGMEIRAIDAMINHNTTEVFFDNMEIPADSLIGEEGKGFRYVMSGMNAERVIIAGESIGMHASLLNALKPTPVSEKFSVAPLVKTKGSNFQ